MLPSLFIVMFLSPLCLNYNCRIQKKFYLEVSYRGLFIVKTKLIITIATNLEWGVRTFQLNHENLECLKQIPPKPGDLKREDFQNMCQVQPKKQIIFVMIFFTPIGQWVAKLGCHKAFPQTLANLWLMGIRMELDSLRFPDSLWNLEAK